LERYRLDEVKFALVIGSGGDSLNRYRRRLAPVRTPVVARTPLPPPFSRKIFNLRGLRRVPRCKILVSLRLSVKSSLETTYENCCIASAHFMVQFILALVSLFTLSIPRARFAGLRDQACDRETELARAGLSWMVFLRKCVQRILGGPECPHSIVRQRGEIICKTSPGF
jgi:hypothetical protein